MNDDTGLVFSDDFATRVFGEAERVAVRRLRGRRLLGTAAAAAAGLAFLFWIVIPTGAPDTRSAVDVPRLVAVQPLPVIAQEDESGALDYLFPDAEPVARLAAEYSDANDAGETDFFADDDAGTP